jgi:serine/threonine protein kinase
MKRDNFTFPKGSHIGDYEVLFLMGSGGFSNVYKVAHRSTRAVFALKTERLGTSATTFVQNEITCCEDLNLDCFPKISGHGKMGDLIFMVMPIYGHSVSMIASTYEHHLPPTIALPIAFEMLRVTERLHSFGFIHRDIKPANFLLNQNPNAPLVLIDFGVAIRHIDSTTGLPFAPAANPNFVGTKKYASVAAHKAKSLGRKDDLISWFYSTIDLVVGELPWSHAKSNEELVQQKKMSAHELCAGLQSQYEAIYQYLKGLKYEDTPDYKLLREKIGEIAGAQGIVLGNFQWQKFYLNHSLISEKNVGKKKSCGIQ